MFYKKIQEVTCKLQAYISVYQEGLETEFCISPHNSNLSEMIEERAIDERVKKSLEPCSLKLIYKILQGQFRLPVKFFPERTASF